MMSHTNIDITSNDDIQKISIQMTPYNDININSNNVIQKYRFKRRYTMISTQIQMTPYNDIDTNSNDVTQ